MQQQQQHLLHPSDSRDYQEQFLARARQQQLIPRSQAPRIIKYADAHGQHPSDSHGHSRSSSTSSLDVDEMLLRATTGDEHAGGAPNGSGTPCIDSTHHHLNINQRRRSDREGDSPRPHSANNGNGQNPGHITTTTNPYPPQHPSNVSYPANQSAPVMNSLRPPAQNVQNQVIQTHIFAPVVTGAPTKKTKFPNTIQAGPGNGAGLPGMSFYFCSHFSFLLFGLAMFSAQICPIIPPVILCSPIENFCPIRSPSLHIIQCTNMFF
jgi:hypothetical protein